MMRKVLIVGGTGTISKPIARKLAQDKETMLFLLNRGNRDTEWRNQVIQLEADIHDTAKVRELLETYEFDCVVSFIIYNSQDAQENIELFRGKTRQFIYISTAAAYCHELGCHIDETTVLGNQCSAYGRGKQEAEERFMEAFRKEGFPVTIVRPSQTYSEGRIPLSVKGKNCWSVVDRMMRGKEVIVHSDGQSVWCSTHAEDFAEGFVPLVANLKCVGEAYQIMNEEFHTWDMVYRTLSKLIGAPYRPVYIPAQLLRHVEKYDLNKSIYGDKRYSVSFKMDKLKAVYPGFKCKIGLEEGLRRYLVYMDGHPELKVEDPDFDTWCDELIGLFRLSEREFLKEIEQRSL